MKKTMFFIFLTVLTQSCCNQNNKKEITPVSDSKSVSKNFDWLLGNWERQNEKEGRTTYERWIKTGEAAMRVQALLYRTVIPYQEKRSDWLKMVRNGLWKLPEKRIQHLQFLR
jgi:hypothetical protein